MDVNTNCPRCAASASSIVRDGYFWLADDSKNIQRFKCRACSKKFSAATRSPAYRQKRRRINETVRLGLSFKMCQRDIAQMVGINVKTVAYIPNATHEVLQSVKGAIVGQGELKKTRFDPLFTINHCFFCDDARQSEPAGSPYLVHNQRS